MCYESVGTSMYFSRVSILFWVCGFQAIDPYSNFDHTSILWAAYFTFGLAGYRVLLSRPSVLADLDAVLSKHCFVYLVQDSLVSMQWPIQGEARGARAPLLGIPENLKGPLLNKCKY